MVVLTSVAVWGLAAQTPAPALPAGRGRAQLQRVCGMCHGIEVVTKMRAGKQQWSEIVDDMVSKGATGTSDDFELVVQYLATNFGPVTREKVEINKTSADQIVAALGMSQAEASRPHKKSPSARDTRLGWPSRSVNQPVCRRLQSV
ncbi:MAG: hypothetical protein EBT04_13510 [Betaproteobacteria bacterium]|nr:hypothetical protein [Betaproteobacteria bacterium]